MKKYDLILLKDSAKYKEENLTENMRGIIINAYETNADVLFFNPFNVGEYAIINVEKSDLIIEKEKLPPEYIKELASKEEILINKNKGIIEKPAIKAYDRVELIKEDEKYSKFGIHKGDTGCVMEDIAIKNKVEVDFSGVDKNGEYYGDQILVDIRDLKVIK